MKKKMKVKAILSFVLVLAMVLSSFNVMPSKAETLTQIGWETFGFTYDSQLKAGSAPWENAKQATSYTDLDNTEFVGDVILADNSSLRYGGNCWNQGVQIKTENGVLVMIDITNSDAEIKRVDSANAGDYNLASFVNTQFTLKIQSRKLENGYMNTTVYINDVQLGETNLYSGSIGNYLCACDSGTVTLKETIPPFTPIGWETFGFTYDSQLKAGSAPWENAKQATSYTDLDNTEFVGDVILADNSSLRYGGNCWNQGVQIKTENGVLVMIDITNSDAEIKRVDSANAGDYNLASFVNTQFTLKIQSRKLENGYMNTTVYINDVQLGETNLYSGSIGNYLCACDSGTVTIKKTMPALTKITWRDFNEINYGTSYSTTEVTSTYGENTASSINNTVFEDDIIFSNDSFIMYATSNGWHGLRIGLNADGKFIANGCGYYDTTDSAVYDATTFELDTLVDQRITLKIEMREVTDTTANVKVYVNGIPAGDGFSLTGPAQGCANLGSTVAFGTACKNKVTIPYKDVELPTGLDELSWEEFGYTGNIMNVDTGVLKSAKHLTDLYNTVFNGDISMANNAWLRYGVDSFGNGGGVCVQASTTGLTVSLIQDDAAIKSYTATPSSYDVSSFVDTQFNLKITVENLTSNPTIGVWVNDKLVGDLFEAEAQGLTHGTPLMMSYGVTPVSHRTTAPTGLKEIRFSDWNSDVAADGNLTNLEITGKHPTQTTLIGTSLYEVVNFQDTENVTGHHLFVYGGMTGNGNLGLRIWLNDTNMQVQCNDGSKIRENFTVDPQKAGVGTTFRGVEFSWKIDTVQLGQNVLVYMSFNDHLYNNAPFVLYDFADLMSNEIQYNSHETPSEVAKCYVKLGPATKTLPELYHNLSKGAFTLPSGVTQLEQRENDAWNEITVVTSLDAVGDYRITFNDGVSDYIQEVVLTKKDTASAQELVRALRLKQGVKEKGDYANSAFRACDKNYDNNIDASDIRDIRSILLGTYKEGDTMKISGYFGPTGALIEDANYQKISTTGVNHIIETELVYTDDAISRYHVYKELAYAQKYGMTVTVRDGRLKAMAEKGDPITTYTVTSKIADYNYYQSFDGLFIIDEPYTASYPGDGREDTVTKYQSLATAINGAGIEGWSNVFGGSNDFFSRAKKYGYYNYLNDVATRFNMKFLSFTYYPFWNEYPSMADNATVQTSKNFFTNLALVKDVATTKGIPFRTFVQGGEGFEYEPNGDYTESQFKWNANIGLAFGSKAVQYFPLVHPESLKNYGDGTCASGLIDSTGNQTKFGEWATNVNKQVAAIDDVLMNATNEGYMSTGGYATTVATDTIKSITMYSKYLGSYGYGDSKTVTNTIHSSYAGATVTSDDATYGAFTGCFTLEDGRHAMYIVNFSDVNDNTITVSFGSDTTVTTVLNGEKETTTGTTITKKLGAGEAVLVVY